MYRITPCLLSLLLLLVSCKKEKEKDPLSQLPPETQTGANTFGCLVNGKVFTPGGVPGWAGSTISSYYQLVDDRYHFVLNVRNRKSSIDQAIGLFADSLKLAENKKYQFSTRENGNVSARYSYSDNSVSKTFITGEDIYIGELWIKKLDTVKLIVSGFFWFNAIDENGEKIEIREGRFDMRYRR